MSLSYPSFQALSSDLTWVQYPVPQAALHHNQLLGFCQVLICLPMIHRLFPCHVLPSVSRVQPDEYARSSCPHILLNTQIYCILQCRKKVWTKMHIHLTRQLFYVHQMSIHLNNVQSLDLMDMHSLFSAPTCSVHIRHRTNKRRPHAQISFQNANNIKDKSRSPPKNSPVLQTSLPMKIT